MLSTRAPMGISTVPGVEVHALAGLGEPLDVGVAEHAEDEKDLAHVPSRQPFEVGRCYPGAIAAPRGEGGR